jgi:Transposase
MMQDVQDEPLFAERVAGLDIAKAEVEVTIRVPSDTTAGRRQQETRTFGTTRRELESLGDWLACWGVTKIGMEATGDYWKPVFFLLESRGFDCQLYNAGQVKALPGRPKTDLLTEHSGVLAGHRPGGTRALKLLTCFGPYLRGQKGARAGCATTESGNTALYRRRPSPRCCLSPGQKRPRRRQNCP